jgi:putative sigma-54 modulation protein
MRIEIYSSKLELPDDVHAHIERRLQFALSWASDKLQRITVRLEDINGPKGGADKSCRIHIAVVGAKPVIVDELQSDLYIAIDRAVERAGRALTRSLARTREHGHGRYDGRNDLDNAARDRSATERV